MEFSIHKIVLKRELSVTKYTKSLCFGRDSTAAVSYSTQRPDTYDIYKSVELILAVVTENAVTGADRRRYPNATPQDDQQRGLDIPIVNRETTRRAITTGSIRCTTRRSYQC